MNFKSERLFYASTLYYALIWLTLAFNVHNRSDWLLENILVFIFIGPSIWLYRKRYISLSSYIHVIVFLIFHSVGAHYTYSLVPYDEWAQEVMGLSLSTIFAWQRNHYDRLVHFLWGLLLFLPFQDVIKNTTPLKSFALTFFTFSVLIVFSALYEIIEWLAAMVFGGNLGHAFVGTQGDVWDAQKDQAIALMGSIMAFILTRTRKCLE